MDQINNYLQDISIPSQLITSLCCTLVVWLHIKAGISQATANTVLHSLHFILSTLLSILSVTICSTTGIEIKFPDLQIPHDICTAIHQIQGIDPTIVWTICCPICYKQYTSAPFPMHCDWKETPRSYPCNASLWCTQRFGKISKLVPVSLYNTQDFESWISFFLGQHIIEDYLEAAFLHNPAALGADMHDFQDSPAWKDLQDFLKSRYNLVFGLYIDWFNPHTNKIAGLYCSDKILI